MQTASDPLLPQSPPPRHAKIVAARAGEICQLFELSEAAARLRDDGLAPLKFVRKLLGAECYADAVAFLAHALPKREAVWWSCLCARDTPDGRAAGAALAAVTAAEAWVYDPVEETRRAAAAAAGAVDTGSPCAWPALAAFWAGDDIAPAGSTVRVPPAEHMCAKAVTAAIALAATKLDWGTAAQGFQRYLAQGIDIAEGGSGRRPAAKS
jgi:hypothetical protein